ncbi:MAG: sulfatase-like hydrolase/transferase, partial [Verrucomicrobiota bacterium]
MSRALLFLFCCVVTFATADDRPNIIMIMADDLGAETIGAYGALDYKTPVLDKMASEGLKFDRAYSTPLCNPTRVQLMTGRYTHRNYVKFGLFPSGEKTFGNLLKGAGYATCMVGKWQLGGDHQTPHELGFDEYCLQNGIRPEKPFDRKTRGRERFWGYPVIVANGELYESEETYGPDMLNEYARDFVRRKSEAPFFLYYPMILPHSPFAPTPKSKDGDKSGAPISEVKYFGDMVEYIDHLVGNLLSTLDEEGIRDNTLVLFTGDNGTTYPVKVTAPAPEGFAKVDGINGARHLSQLPPEKQPTPKEGFEGPLTRNGSDLIPGGKDLMSHRGVHVPLIVDWPKHRETYAKVENQNAGLVDFTDFLTTFVELAEADLPEDRIQ